MFSRAVGSFRVTSSSPLLRSTTRRSLFYPTAAPPSHTSFISQELPAQSRPHISPGQFKVVRDVGGESRIKTNSFDLIEMNFSRENNARPKTPAERWEARPSPSVPTSLGKYVGRTVYVRPNESVAIAHARLQGILRINNIRQELKLTERHEKKGVKRRRLRSARWRRRFAVEVRKQVKLVTEIRLRDRMWGARH